MHGILRTHSVDLGVILEVFGGRREDLGEGEFLKLGSCGALKWREVRGNYEQV